MSKRILIVDDEVNIGRSLQIILEGEGYNVLVCGTAAEFRARIALYRSDVCLLDVRLPDGNGIDLLRFLRQNDNHLPVIMISGHGTIADAVEAIRSGAFDFLEKPLGRDKVLVVVKNALDQANLRRENERFRETVGDAPKMIGSSAVFQHTVQQATLVARSDARVLLTGESGTGKELLAQNRFREDLFYRLSVVPIRVPPLRERRDDVRALAEYFLAEFCVRNNFKRKTIEDEVFSVLEDYAWPGNARELKNAVERMA